MRQAESIDDTEEGCGRIMAFVMAAVSAVIAGLALWAFIYLNSRESDPSQNIVGQFAAQATDRITAVFCLAVAVVNVLLTPMFIVCGLYARRRQGDSHTDRTNVNES